MTYPTVNLQFGQSGSDVTKLQQFLISQGMNIPSGATGYFGNETKNALSQWQQKTGIDAGSGLGYWGPKSITKASSLNTTTTSPFQQTNPFKQTTSTTPTTTSPFQQTNPFQQTTSTTNSNNSSIFQQTNPFKATTPVNSSPYTPPASNPSQNNTEIPAIPTKLTQEQKDFLLSDIIKQLNSGTLSREQAAQYAQAVNAIPVITTIDPTKPKDPNTETNTTSELNDILDSSISGTTIEYLPEEATKILTPHLIPGTPEYQAAMDKVNSSYFDILQQQMNASTEQEKMAAEYNWQTLKKTIEQTLNINLSNDSYQAWDQIQTLKNQYGQANIQGSGIQNESIDAYLNKVRRTDSMYRTQAQNDQEAKKQNYYTNFATPQQIAELVKTNPELARSWGLMPSDEVKNAMTYAALKAKYPTMTDEQIQSNIASILDENGNYRSALYQKYMVGSSVGANDPKVATQYDPNGNPISTTVTPIDTGVLDINKAKETNKIEQINLQNAINDQTNRDNLGSTPATDIHDSDASGSAGSNAFSQPATSTSTTSTTPPANKATLDDPLGLNAAATAAAKLGTTGSTNTTGTSTTNTIGSTSTTPYAGGKAPNDPSNKYNTATGKLNPDYQGNKFNIETGKPNPFYKGA